MEMTAGGKPGKPKAGFPPFPPALESPQSRRPSHIPTASTTGSYSENTERLSRAGLTAEPKKPSTSRVGQNKLPKWAKISCQTHSSGTPQRGKGDRLWLSGLLKKGVRLIFRRNGWLIPGTLEYLKNRQTPFFKREAAFVSEVARRFEV